MKKKKKGMQREGKAGKRIETRFPSLISREKSDIRWGGSPFFGRRDRKRGKGGGKVT